MARGDYKVDILTQGAETYYEAFNITKERANELMLLIRMALIGESTQAEMMEALSLYPETQEELVFTMFKLGEFTGLLQGLDDPMYAIGLVNNLKSLRRGKDDCTDHE